MSDDSLIIVSKILPRGVVQIQGGALLRAAGGWRFEPAVQNVDLEPKLGSLAQGSLRPSPHKKIQKKHKEKEKNIRKRASVAVHCASAGFLTMTF
ncbi:MAG: hypothetical protein ABSB26_03650 [Nitrososphaerales archaeon]